MIREKLLALRERRGLLLALAGQQRAGLHAIVERAETATAWFDSARALFGGLRAHPAWVAAAIALLVALRPRATLKWVATGVSIWRGWRSLRAALERLAPRQPPASNTF